MGFGMYVLTILHTPAPLIAIYSEAFFLFFIILFFSSSSHLEYGWMYG